MKEKTQKIAALCIFLILVIGVGAFAFHTFMIRPLVIGFSANLTGRNSEIGISSRNGAQLALEEINNQGGINGRKLEMKVVDDMFSDDTARSVDAGLLSNGVFAIIGHLTSNTGMAVKENYTSGKYLYLSPLVSTDALSNKDDFFFRVISSNQIQGEMLATYAIENDKVKKFAIVYEETNSAYTKQFIEFSEAVILSKGGEITSKTFFTSDESKDLKKTVQAALNTNPEGVIIVASGVDTAVLSQNFKKKNREIGLYAGTFATTPDLITIGGNDVEGLVAVTIYSEEDMDGPLRSFTRNYEEKYNKRPDFAAANSYISLNAMAKALKITKTFTPAALKAALLSISDYDGLNGAFRFNRYGDVSRPYCLIKVTNGHFKKVK